MGMLAVCVAGDDADVGTGGRLSPQARPLARGHRRNGAWRRFAIRAVPVLDNAGNIREWVGVQSDFTEARLQLARNAETFALLVRNCPFDIYAVDKALRLVEISEGRAKAFGKIDPLIGRDIAEVLRLAWGEPFASEALVQFEETLEPGLPYVSLGSTDQRANIDATEAYDWHLKRIALPDGSDGVVCYFYDLYERISLEDELRQAITDKELLAREIEHRVQNSLAIVCSLLNLQRSIARTVDTKDALTAASARVLAIARLVRVFTRIRILQRLSSENIYVIFANTSNRHLVEAR